MVVSYHFRLLRLEPLTLAKMDSKLKLMPPAPPPDAWNR